VSAADEDAAPDEVRRDIVNVSSIFRLWVVSVDGDERLVDAAAEYMTAAPPPSTWRPTSSRWPPPCSISSAATCRSSPRATVRATAVRDR
jgi:hypothetical protein